MFHIFKVKWIYLLMILGDVNYSMIDIECFVFCDQVQFGWVGMVDDDWESFRRRKQQNVLLTSGDSVCYWPSLVNHKVCIYDSLSIFNKMKILFYSILLNYLHICISGIDVVLRCQDMVCLVWMSGLGWYLSKTLILLLLCIVQLSYVPIIFWLHLMLWQSACISLP